MKTQTKIDADDALTYERQLSDELEENSRHFMGIKQRNIPSLIFTLRQSCFSSKVI